MCGSELLTERLDVFNPLIMVLEGVGRETYDLDIALLEVLVAAGDFSELSGADGGEVAWVREEDTPGVTEPIVELDVTRSGVSFEVGGNITKTQTHF